MPQIQKRFMQTEINFVLEKNGSHKSSGLGGRLTVVVRQAGRQINFATYELLKIRQL